MCRIGFEERDDAERVMDVLPKRLAKFALTLHPDKTRLLPFDPPRGGESGGGPTFDSLGFTLHWQKSQSGRWRLALKTRRARLRRAIRSATEWCLRHRHLTVKEQHGKLCEKLRGHFNYFGVNGNVGALRAVVDGVEKAWWKWLNRRSHCKSMDWVRFHELLRVFPLPRPRVAVQLWRR